MKKLLVIVLVIALAFAFVGCAGETQTPAATEKPAEQPAQQPAEQPPQQPAEQPAQEGPIKVAGVVFQEDQFMKLLQLGYKHTAEAAGFEFTPGNTNSDAAKEIEMLRTYADQGYKGVAITPHSETASLQALREANEAGLIIGISNYILTSEEYVVGNFTSDNYELGKSTGEVAKKYIEEKLGGKAKIAVIQFKSLLPEQSGARSSGFLDVVKQLPGVEIVDDQDAWLQDKAITLAQDMLTANPDIDIIWSANEGGTIGATMGVKNAGKAGEVVVFGTDASEQMCDLLLSEDNILQAVTGQDPYTIGVKTMEAVVKAIKGEDISDTKGKGIIVPGIVLERSKPDAIKVFLEDLKAKTGA